MASGRWWRPDRLLRVPVLALPILTAFAGVVGLLVLVLAWWRGSRLDDPGNLSLAVLCGLIAGLFLTVFHFKRESVVVPVKDARSFLAQCRAALDDLGYVVQERPDGELASRPPYRSMLLGGTVQVRAGGTEARIVGPKVFVEMLRQRMRLQSHLAQVERQSREGRSRPGDRLLKRVRLVLRLTPDQWDDAGAKVVRQLAADGAEVICEVHLMAQSLHGIREEMVEGSVREWLRSQEITAEVHKDYICWDEPASKTVPHPLADTQLVATPGR
jgi:hypothetical protein